MPSTLPHVILSLAGRDSSPQFTNEEIKAQGGESEAPEIRVWETWLQVPGSWWNGVGDGQVTYLEGTLNPALCGHG